ncbi:MAG: oxygen-independent coproporphyrinogen III oxidase [Phycisphaerales bacterium]|nr:MAG: oxygen-independent coproporphyrinogen III oxidase [Phycisphaerales bacterium]
MTSGLSTIDLDVFRRYSGLSLPRHVSYPMPTGWRDLQAVEATAMLRESRQRSPANDISLYLHVPFCERLCRYCACTRIIRPRSQAESISRTRDYVAALLTEIDALAGLVGGGRTLRQVHWGGGTPTYLSTEQLERVHAALSESFCLADDAEVAMELDPRVLTSDVLEHLRRLGVCRVSLGVQDFNARVQEHVRRVQPFEMVRDIVAACRDLGFTSLNFDLIYGLPYQTRQTIQETIDKTIALSPDRIAYYHYAQIPEKVASQRGLDYTRLPDSESKLEMFLLGVERFEAAGYVFIGLDHFAKPDEPLAVALREGTLQRNFQGMTTGGGLDLIGVGASAIGHLAGIGFLQNVHDPDEYVACLNRGDWPVTRGKRLTFDDRVRQSVITQLYCSAEIRPTDIEEQFGVTFASYFGPELDALRELEADGLVTLQDDGRVKVTRPMGRVLLRNIAAVFDAYLEPNAYREGDRRCFSASA